MIRTELDSMPAELDEISRRVLQLEIEETALKQEKDKSSKDRLETLRKDLGNARDKMETIKRKWENERKGIDDVQSKMQLKRPRKKRNPFLRRR